MPLVNGWTGGQYSLFRFAFGSYLLIHFLHLLPWGQELFSNQGVLPQGGLSPMLHLFPNVLGLWDGPLFVQALLLVGGLLSVFFAAGKSDRAAAILLWYIWACLLGRNPLILNPSYAYVGWILLAHCVVPAAPYGSVAARGRVNPRGDWKLPQSIFLAAWLLMALGYSYSGWTKLISPSWVDGTAFAHVLENPLARPTGLRELLLALPSPFLQAATWSSLALELGFAPLALFARLRPWLWTAMVAMHLGLLVLLDFSDLTLGMLVLHAFTFDPAWVPARQANSPDLIFYDGHCGLCHRTVRFVLAEEGRENFRFAPLISSAFESSVGISRRVGLPDSIILKKADGGLLVRSAAVIYILQGLGGIWRLIGLLLQLVPARMRDEVYDAVAGVRHRLFAPPVDACPLLPTHLRARFDT